MPLQDELNAFRAEWKTKAPAERQALYERKIEELRASGIARTALGAGDRAPDFSLTEARGGVVRLAQRLADGPVVLAFYRGGWCPYCNIQLRAYQKALAEFARHGASLLAISPQLPDGSLSTAETNALSFPVLSDPGNGVAQSFGIAWTLPPELQAAMTEIGKALPGLNGDDSWSLPVPATFVIAQDGKIALSHVDADYRNRLDVAEILGALAGIPQPV